MQCGTVSVHNRLLSGSWPGSCQLAPRWHSLDCIVTFISAANGSLAELPPGTASGKISATKRCYAKLAGGMTA